MAKHHFPRVAAGPIPADPWGCEESHPQLPAFPCNTPATRMIGWPERDARAYRMCDFCAHHSLKNRGATDMGPFTAVS